MGVRDIIQGAFAHVRTLVPDLEVTVVNPATGETTVGIQSMLDSKSKLNDDGDLGTSTQSVRVNEDYMTAPKDGATILVNGDEMIVSQTRKDPISAFIVIEYVKTRPQT